MGYVDDTHFSQFIPVTDFNHSAGTWTVSVASNVLKSVRTAADATWNTHIPIRIPSNQSALKGARLQAIEVFYTIGTADLDDFATVELEKIVFTASAAPTGSAVTGACDSSNNTAALRKAQGFHAMTFTITTPAWLDDWDEYVLLLAVDAAATSVFTFWGAVAYYELRA